MTQCSKHAALTLTQKRTSYLHSRSKSDNLWPYHLPYSGLSAIRVPDKSNKSDVLPHRRHNVWSNMSSLGLSRWGLRESRRSVNTTSSSHAGSSPRSCQDDWNLSFFIIFPQFKRSVQAISLSHTLPSLYHPSTTFFFSPHVTASPRACSRKCDLACTCI